MINKGALVKFNDKFLDVRDVLYGLIEMTFEVLYIEEETNCVALHSYPADAASTYIVLGVERRLLISLERRANPREQRLVFG